MRGGCRAFADVAESEEVAIQQFQPDLQKIMQSEDIKEGF